MGGKFKEQLSAKSGPRSRKDLRKQMRIEKKAKKNDYFKNKKKIAMIKNSVIDNNSKPDSKNIPTINKTSNTLAHKKDASTTLKNQNKPPLKKIKKVKFSNLLDEQNKHHNEELREKAKLVKGMMKSRKKMLFEANKVEDKEIKKLEKQLKLNKRKSKSIPKSFIDEGLDYLLEVCDSDKLNEAGTSEVNLYGSDVEFEDDVAQITGKNKRLKSDEGKPNKMRKSSASLSTPKNADNSDEDSCDEKSIDSDGSHNFENNDIDSEKEDDNFENSEDEGKFNDESTEEDAEFENFNEEDEVDNDSFNDDNAVTNGSDIGDDDEFSDNKSLNKENNSADKSDLTMKKKQDNETWEDIYGRLRDKKGDVIQPQEKGKYIPPHLRAQQLGDDTKRAEELARLKKQLKGLVNRLAESNMHSIAKQIDEMYMRNSRNDMNDCLMSLITEALIGRVLTPERLVMEQIMLIAILHANVGMEIGAHFLECFVKKFNNLFNENQEVENKELDNILLIISHLYNFKVFHAVLLYNILDQLVERFTEKEVELILLVLRSVGLSMRKDDPLALKNLVLKLQKKAHESTHLRDNTRVKFMLDVLLAVKNNNMTKIPLYDPTHSEHLKKLIKTMIHKGKYITELKVTLEDLLKAEERGRWWIVGSAWTGAPATVSAPTQTPAMSQGSQFSQTVLELARKQRMNTDTRRNIFCILITAEDYLDAFEKLLRLGLKGQQEQEIVHVMVHCLLSEKGYNPYYAHLATHICQADRKHQMAIQYHMWDKFKELSNLSQFQITNLAKYLAHLFLEKALPISVLKVLQFSEMDKRCVRLLRQVLLTVLLTDSLEVMTAVFTRVARPEKLRMFRESLRLFLHHFVLRNISDLPEDQGKLIRERVKLAETALVSVDTTTKLL